MASNDTEDPTVPLSVKEEEEEEEVINANDSNVDAAEDDVILQHDEVEEEEPESASRQQDVEAKGLKSPKKDGRYSSLVEIRTDPVECPTPVSESDVTVRQPSSIGKKTMGRYKNGLKKALPVRCVKKTKDVLPLDTNGLCNFMTFGWLTSIMWSIHKKGIKAVKNMRITEAESAETNTLRIEQFWEEELQVKGPENASFGKAVFQSFKTRIIIGAIASLLYAFFSLANPMLVIRYFLEYLSEGDVSVNSGIVYVVLLTIIILLKALIDGFFWMLNIEAAVRIKNGYLGLLFKKIVHVKELKDKAVGDVVNFLSNDGLRIWYGIIMGPYAIGGPMILIMSCVYSIVYMGPWALLAWVVIIGFYPFALGLAKKSMDFREESIKITDKRVALTTELFTYIKVIKMYAWEKPFARNVLELRRAEHQVLQKSVLAQSVSMGSSMFVSLFASCLTFIGYVGSGNNLSPTEAFTFVSLMNIVQGSMMTIPFALKSLSEMFVTNARMKEIMLMESMTSYKSVTSDPSVLLEMRQASFSWASNRYSKNDHDKEMNGVYEDKGDQMESEKLKLKDNENKMGVGGQVYTGPILKDITFTLKMGKRVGLCGPFGCGKSSLINACLGRMTLTSGTVSISKKMAYVSQEAWITNDTIRNNILFGDEYNVDRYKEILEACALVEDLRSFPAGDMTEVGERGATLSGGQKQRISLARAVYSRCPIVLLDDPLSAVDVHVGQHIFQHCVLGLMADRALIFATQQLEYLKDCDQILVMCEGSVIEKGSYQSLMSKNNGELVSLMAMVNRDQENKVRRNNAIDGEEGQDSSDGGDQQESTNCTESRQEQSEGGDGGGDGDGDRIQNHRVNVKDVDLMKDGDMNDETDLARLIREEEMEEGPIHVSTLQSFIHTAGGYVKMAAVLFCFCIPVAGVTTANWYLYYWLKQGGGDKTIMTPDNTTVSSWRVVDHPDKTTYLLVYAAFIPILIILLVIRALCLTKTTLCASSTLHYNAFVRILHCPSSFFDSTPVGRIINRFSADLDEIDMRLPMNLEIFLTNCLQVIAVVAMIIYVSPYFALASVPLGVVFYFLMHVFHSCIHELKNLDNVTRSPVLSHIGATVQGLATVHAYDKTGTFLSRHCQLLNANAVAVFLFFAANRWLAFWLDVISAIVIFLTGILILVTFDLMDAGLAGLALSFAIQMSGLFQFTTRLAVETEARFASVERIQEYANTPDQENVDDASSTSSTSSWPTNGEIQLKNANLRYKPGLSLALSNINLHIKGKETIGIVGRTGAGKTSLTTALFRLTSLESGTISIDGVNITSLSLKQLRSSLSIIPQDPVLFAGTLRYNLDPSNQYSDADVWRVLERCNIQDMVKSLDLQLDTEVKETGSNFSVGERQLLCLSRALLRNSKILILDEATTAIDPETSGLIQKALKEEFLDRTMLIIAHRLTSVTDCDRVVVMEKGEIKECDSPSSLLSNPNSKFKAMYDAALTSHS